MGSSLVESTDAAGRSSNMKLALVLLLVAAAAASPVPSPTYVSSPVVHSSSSWGGWPGRGWGGSGWGGSGWGNRQGSHSTYWGNGGYGGYGYPGADTKAATVITGPVITLPPVINDLVNLAPVVTLPVISFAPLAASKQAPSYGYDHGAWGGYGGYGLGHGASSYQNVYKVSKPVYATGYGYGSGYGYGRGW